MTSMNPTTADTGLGSSIHLNSRDPLFTSPQRSSSDWQTYYTYAQQLYASGDHARAEAYYLCAQQLYYTEGVHSSDEYHNAVPTCLLLTNSGAQSGCSTKGNKPNQLDSHQRPKTSRRRRRIVISTFVILIVFALLVVESANILLLGLYQHQKSQKNPHDYHAFVATAPFYLRPLLKLPEKEPVQDMVSAMQLTFERVIRVSQSAEPLLYELGLRNTLPNHYARTDTGDVKPKPSAHTTGYSLSEIAPSSQELVSLSPYREANDTADVSTWTPVKKTVKTKTTRDRRARARAQAKGRNRSQQRANRKSRSRYKKRNTHANQPASARRKRMVNMHLSDDPLADLLL